jgi:hypothetical protein
MATGNPHNINRAAAEVDSVVVAVMMRVSQAGARKPRQASAIAAFPAGNGEAVAGDGRRAQE